MQRQTYIQKPALLMLSGFQQRQGQAISCHDGAASGQTPRAPVSAFVTMGPPAAQTPADGVGFRVTMGPPQRPQAPADGVGNSCHDGAASGLKPQRYGFRVTMGPQAAGQPTVSALPSAGSFFTWRGRRRRRCSGR